MSRATLTGSYRLECVVPHAQCEDDDLPGIDGRNNTGFGVVPTNLHGNHLPGMGAELVLPP